MVPCLYSQYNHRQLCRLVGTELRYLDGTTLKYAATVLDIQNCKNRSCIQLLLHRDKMVIDADILLHALQIYTGRRCVLFYQQKVGRWSRLDNLLTKAVLQCSEPVNINLLPTPERCGSVFLHNRFPVHCSQERQEVVAPINPYPCPLTTTSTPTTTVSRKNHCQAPGCAAPTFYSCSAGHCFCLFHYSSVLLGGENWLSLPLCPASVYCEGGCLEVLHTQVDLNKMKEVR